MTSLCDQNWFRVISLTAVLIAALRFAAPVSPAPVGGTIRTEPPKLVNGAPFLVRVRTPYKVASLTGTWLGHQLAFTFDGGSNTWFAFAGTSFDTKPGIYPIEVVGKREPEGSSEHKLTLTRTLAVERGKYPILPGHLPVPGKYTEPNDEQTREIEESKKVKDDYFNRETPDRKWSGDFTAPAKAEISDVFGARRVFNGKTQGLHMGLDFRVPTGTPVAAMNSGTVLLARPLYFEGNLVVLDHGQGLLTLYLHLSEFKVKEGDVVKRGDVIGLSGGTGRATGPHLHVAVRWQGVNLDPQRMMQLQLP
jgi:hypothetical protein